MSETERIWNLLQRSFEGNEAWKCPSLRDLLAEVTAAQAQAHPIAGAPSIWELLLHTTAYERVACRRLAGEAVASLPGALAWPKPEAVSNDAWLRARLDFGDARRALRQAVAAFPEARLNEPVPRARVQLLPDAHGVVEHALYHAGQVEMLMLAQGVRPKASPMAASREAPPPPA
jgi:uncharacterized damage-inducible protein DinB